ncbi:TPA: GNAT family N-acetyltransferase [Acinetobacter baumannii]|uniref:GNAT family N-acetyltransferase n=2 Tax=Acinetobacter baumannii TaxID=470 RepID=UPI000289834E|nr:GNAT family N-acetyltransferase [Acinetobacter baumannii]EHU2375862.1 GNAT family N-acetyltransferase [Acinetobacter baumannii]EHU2749433.1 GNAT family N-acetyltransferase [Acinetobacter baumannii]EKU7310597.1 GNAT family N-acetyltransferase [Acinetobacter baumannii]EXB80696.1 acetyltransferase family protein [Acinetobacter baumannii 299505]EXG92649.1 acetyltransferase family protein [Acinetobacter baumannii 1062314]
MQILRLSDYPQYKEMAAQWFSEKWQIPVEAYLESIQISIDQKHAIPQWYIVLNKDKYLIAGAGVIDNDFHERKDLTPNLCALFVEENYRNQNIAKNILDFVREDLSNQGIQTLYLITDHTEFYEKCGWRFLTLVEDEEGEMVRMYVADTF